MLRLVCKWGAATVSGGVFDCVYVNNGSVSDLEVQEGASAGAALGSFPSAHKRSLIALGGCRRSLPCRPSP